MDKRIFIILAALLLLAVPTLAEEKKVVITRTSIESDFYPLGEKITGTVTFRFEGTWNPWDSVLLEAGIFPAGQRIRQGRLNNPLAIGQVKGSRASVCDGHKSWSNIKLYPALNWDQFREITLTFSVEPPDSKSGQHDILFGAYTGCGGNTYEQLGTKIYIRDEPGSSSSSGGVSHSVDIQGMTINGKTFGVVHQTGNPIVVTGTIISNTPGRSRYLAECSIVKGDYQPLLFLFAKHSACDGNPHYSGEFHTFEQGEKASFQFEIQDYGRGPGEETIVCGVYTDCGGAELARDRRIIQVTAPPAPPGDTTQKEKGISTFAIIAGIASIVGLIVAVIGYFTIPEVSVIGIVVFLLGLLAFAQQMGWLSA